MENQKIILTWIFACSDAWKNQGCILDKNGGLFHGDESHDAMLLQITTQLRPSTRNKDLYQHLPKGAV